MKTTTNLCAGSFCMTTSELCTQWARTHRTSGLHIRSHSRCACLVRRVVSARSLTFDCAQQIPTQTEETARIRPPVLTLFYGERSVASFAQDSSLQHAELEFIVR